MSDVRKVDQNRLINGKEKLFVQRDGERYAASNGDWALYGERAVEFADALIQVDLIPDGRHALNKRRTRWELEQGTGPDMFAFAGRFGTDTLDPVIETGLVWGRDDGSDLSILRQELSIPVLVQRPYMDTLRHLLPTADLAKDASHPDSTPLFFVEDGATVALLFPVNNRHFHAVDRLMRNLFYYYKVEAAREAANDSAGQDPTEQVS